MNHHTIDVLLDRVELQAARIRTLERLLEQARRIAIHVEGELAHTRAAYGITEGDQ